MAWKYWTGERTRFYTSVDDKLAKNVFNSLEVTIKGSDPSFASSAINTLKRAPVIS